ncbi:Hypothetical predicted protein [Paramuricea clavata]|uniref:Uncharacterized protein n=1 Tax=Paramuricea clavata TaxID=317549 RepID=A0A6S7GHL3_PARCT|nr:Hypothetical predicted protein [Paramuricea clavata]
MADNMMNEESRGRFTSTINSLKELLARSQHEEELNKLDEGSVTELFGHIQQQQQMGNTSQSIPNIATESTEQG